MLERTDDRELERSTTRWMQWAVVLTLAMALAFPLYRLWEPSGRAAAREDHVASIEAHGRELFGTNCANCHGAEGTGGSAPALNSQEFLLATEDGQIRQLISVGVPGTSMSPYLLDYGGPFTLEQVDALTAYLRSLEEDAPERPDWRTPGETEDS